MSSTNATPTTITTTTTANSDELISNFDNLITLHKTSSSLSSSSLSQQKSNITISPLNSSVLNNIINFNDYQNNTTTTKQLDINKEPNKQNSSSPIPLSLSLYLPYKDEINPDTLYYIPQIQQLVSTYAYDQFTRFTTDKTSSSTSSSFLSKHPISPNVRTKMVNWLLEVVEVMGCEPATYFLTIYIFDSYLNKTKTHYTDNDIHLLGITSLYIASKVEDIYPLRMTHIVSDIGKNAHDSDEVKALERKIIIELDFNLMPSLAYDFMMLSISDLEANNEDGIKEYEADHVIQRVKRKCVYFLKIMALYKEFSMYVEALKGVACIRMAYDRWKFSVDFMERKEHEFLSEWVRNVIKGSGFDEELIDEVYCKLGDTHLKVIKEVEKYNVSLYYEMDDDEDYY